MSADGKMADSEKLDLLIDQVSRLTEVVTSGFTDLKVTTELQAAVVERQAAVAERLAETVAKQAETVDRFLIGQQNTK